MSVARNVWRAVSVHVPMPCGRGTTRCWYRIGTLTIGPLDAEGAGVLIAGAVSDGLERRPEAGAGVTWVGRLAVGFATYRRAPFVSTLDQNLLES